jgi:hypothetical protein
MKTITLDEAYHILENAAALVINDHVLVYPSLSQLTDDEDNVFLYLSWNNNDSFQLKFAQGDNPTVQVEGSSMFLYDTNAFLYTNDIGEHDHTQITVLVPKKLA